MIEQAKAVEQRLRGCETEFTDDAADTIASLCVALEAAEVATQIAHMQSETHKAEMYRYLNALEAAQKDAARYRWLRSTTNFVTSKGERIDVRESPDLWDESIDAAIVAGGTK